MVSCSAVPNVQSDPSVFEMVKYIILQTVESCFLGGIEHVLQQCFHALNTAVEYVHRLGCQNVLHICAVLRTSKFGEVCMDVYHEGEMLLFDCTIDESQYK